MRKSFFLSIIALAAAVGCSKSEIIDTKFDQAISFENYVGRDAMTKAAVAKTVGTAGIYGYYTATNQWDYDGQQNPENATSGWVTKPKANLWQNGTLSGNGTVEPKKYWTNDEDYYSFVAYAPKENSNISDFPTTEFNGDPVITYTVPTSLGSQVDLLYAGAFNQQKPEEGQRVNLQFQHALSRLTVTAKEDAETDFDFTVTEITVAGDFYTSGKLNLVSGVWTDYVDAVHTDNEETTDVNEKNDTYTIFTGSSKMQTTAVDYASVVAVDAPENSNYLMFIPTGKNNIELTVKYTITYAGETSNVNTKTFAITPTDGFVQGKAYAVNLNFMLDTNNEITFNVTVADWVDGGSQTVYPEGQPAAGGNDNENAGGEGTEGEGTEGEGTEE